MRKPIRTDEGAVELPEERRRGSYPPDVARRRRQLGLPVTPEEHAAYARGETREPPVTRAQMEATLRDVLNRREQWHAPLRQIAARVTREPGEEG
jgi:hypothetical protein